MMLPPDFLNINPEVTTQMRGILIDWLIQVQVSDTSTDVSEFRVHRFFRQQQPQQQQKGYAKSSRGYDLP